jgi:hypothetical protein
MADETTKKEKVAFTAEQMEIIQSMLAETRQASSERRVDAISMYNMRDPKAIESVNIKRINGKFVMGFKNFQNDPFKKTPRYLEYKKDEARGLLQEPFITLLLQEDEKSKVEEFPMLLLDYVTQGKRDQYQAKVVDIKRKKVIEDHGYLGSSGEFATAVDEKGNPEKRTAIMAQTEREERVFLVELPGFSEPVEFIPDFLA